VLFVSADHLRSVGVDPGAIRENLTVEGTDVQEWPVGQRVRVALLRDGLETEVEVTIGLYQDSEAATPEPSERTPRRPAPVPR